MNFIKSINAMSRNLRWVEKTSSKLYNAILGPHVLKLLRSVLDFFALMLLFH